MLTLAAVKAVESANVFNENNPTALQPLGCRCWVLPGP
jgi:hypothetical protein